jgi:SAM-dependent methyltransferase
MPTFEEIYTQHADRYDELVAHEDYQGNLLPTLQAIRPLAQLDVVEVGAGTGRLTHLLAPWVRSIVACDASAHMLTRAAATLRAHAYPQVSLAVADNRRLPIASACADRRGTGAQPPATAPTTPTLLPPHTPPRRNACEPVREWGWADCGHPAHAHLQRRGSLPMDYSAMQQARA